MRNSEAQTRMMKVTIFPIAPSSVASHSPEGAHRMCRDNLPGQRPREKAAAFRTETGYHLARHPELSLLGLEAGRHGAVWQHSQGA